MADDVRLTDLEVIQRYSIAVRGETADRAELVAALRADLAWLEGAKRPKTGRPAPAAERAAEPAAKPARTAAKPATKPAAKPAAAAARKPAKPGKAAAKAGRR